MEEATPVERLHQSDSEVEETKVEELDMMQQEVRARNLKLTLR